MEIKKNINGYTLEVNFDEYKTLRLGMYYASKLWEKYYGIKPPDAKKYDLLYDEMEKARKHFLSAAEAKPLVNCMACKHCLPPFYREYGKMCKLEECNYQPA